MKAPNDAENALAVLLAALIVFVIAVTGLTVAFGVLYLVAWLAQATCAGFGWALPFWPLFGLTTLLAVGTWFIRRR